MSCDSLILEGITFDCDSDNAPIGVERDLILINHSNLDQTSTFSASNISDGTDGNEGGLKQIFLIDTNEKYVFEGKDYSVNPSVSSSVREDGKTEYEHSVSFTVFNTTSVARNSLETLANARVVAIMKSKATGFYELFGARVGLKTNSISREFSGGIASNRFSVSISTPAKGLNETNLPYIATTLS